MIDQRKMDELQVMAQERIRKLMEQYMRIMLGDRAEFMNIQPGFVERNQEVANAEVYGQEG